jgi:hypothetical protein
MPNLAASAQGSSDVFGFWGGLAHGAHIGAANVGQALWALPRWTGVTGLVGLEPLLQQRDAWVEDEWSRIFQPEGWSGTIAEGAANVSADAAYNVFADAAIGKLFEWGGSFFGASQVAPGASQALTQSEASALSKIRNILTNNFKSGPFGDVAGATSDMVGNPVPNLVKGGTYDHVQDLKDILTGLRNNASRLANATDPAAVAARQEALQTAKDIEEAMMGTGL